MLRYLLRNPQEKRIVDVKGFVQKWSESSNRRKDGEERIASCRIFHPKTNSRLNVNLEACKYSCRIGDENDRSHSAGWGQHAERAPLGVIRSTVSVGDPRM